jgi:hypothetical protein
MTANAKKQNKPATTVCDVMLDSEILQQYMLLTLTRCDLLLSEDEFMFPGIVVGKKGTSLVKLLCTVFVVGANAIVGREPLVGLGVLLVPDGDDELEAALPVPDSCDIELDTVVLAAEVVGIRLIRTSGRLPGRSMRRKYNYKSDLKQAVDAVKPKLKSAPKRISLAYVRSLEAELDHHLSSPMIPTAILRSGRSAWKGACVVRDSAMLLLRL